MKINWCWRCKKEVPMFDEAEFAEVSVAFDPFPFSQEFIDFADLDEDGHHDDALSKSMDDFIARAQAGWPVEPKRESAQLAYLRITGASAWDQYSMVHDRFHRLSLYGPPCHSCGKPLRTPKAKSCAACGIAREINS